MSNLRTVASVVTLVLCLTGLAQAADPPTVNEPLAGTVLGRDYVISGSVGYRALMVVLADAIVADTGDLLATVPGIRHWTNDDGTFRFRCASPRVSRGEVNHRLNYRIRCFTMDANGNKGPETVVNCTAAR